MFFLFCFLLKQKTLPVFLLPQFFSFYCLQDFEYLKNNKFIDKDSGEKIPDETIKLLNVQKDATVKQLIKYPELYYAKSSFPLEISQRAFDFLWRMCESYELWCKETGQSEQLLLGITD